MFLAHGVVILDPGINPDRTLLAACSDVCTSILEARTSLVVFPFRTRARACQLFRTSGYSSPPLSETRLAEGVWQEPQRKPISSLALVPSG